MKIARRSLLGISILVVSALIASSQPPPSSGSLSKANVRARTTNAKQFDFRGKSYEQMLAAAGNNAMLLNNLAAHFTRKGEHEKAAECLEKAAKLQPESAPILVNLAIVYANLRDQERSIELLERAAAVNPDYQRSEWVLCDVLSQAQRHDEAVECFDKRLETQQLDAVSVSNMSVSLMAIGKTKRASRILQKAAVRFPDDPAVLNGVGIAFFNRKDYKEAARAYAQLVRLKPDEPQYRFNLAISLLAAKKRSGALEQYNYLKRSDPGLARRLYEVLFRGKVVNARRPSN